MFNYKRITKEGLTELNIGKIVRDSIVAILILVVLFGSFRIVGAGHRGVMLTLGAVGDKTLGEGIQFKLPIFQKIVILDVRTVKYEAEALAYSKDIQTVDAKLALNYHLDPDRTNKVYQEIGKDYESRIINPVMQESLKAVSAKFTAQELIEKREQVKEEVKAQLAERLSVRNIIVDELSIVNFDFSPEYEKAVEEKQVAQQDALTAKNKLEQVKFEAEQRVATATAEARAIQIQAEAITQTGGAEYVNLKAVEKWDGHLPTQMIPNGALPFINLNK
jgi:regulator of protease activity HflC (stomatin/prohibitin superfamily)